MLESAKLKIERANHHVADLERQLIAFTRQNLDSSVRYLNEGGQLDITITALAPPASIAMTIGDAVHNLWTALDHLAWEVVGVDGGSQHKQLYFPKGDSRTSYEASCDGIKTPSKSVKDLFKSLEAFPGGAGHFLYVTCYLDRVDKHRTLTPVVHAPTIDELAIVSDGGKVRRRLSDLYGETVTLREGESFTIDGAPNGTVLAFENDAEISPHILFGNVEFVKNKPIFPTVLQLRHAVANTIDIVERSIS